MTAISQEAKDAFVSSENIAVLTGAGISAESGIPTFRGAKGLWRSYRPEDLATPQAYARNPILVWEWYAMRFETVANAHPNRAHELLAKLEQSKKLTLVTQNVDGLHKRAGSENILELHGNLYQSCCERCGNLDALASDFEIPPHCSQCSNRARPNVVWFGETLPQETFQKAIHAFAEADLALIIGTSGVVEPAASLARLAKEQGAYVIEINPDRTPLSYVADTSLQMSASEGMTALMAGNERA